MCNVHANVCDVHANVCDVHANVCDVHVLGMRVCDDEQHEEDNDKDEKDRFGQGGGASE